MEKLYAFRDSLIDGLKGDPESEDLQDELHKIEDVIAYRNGDETAFIGPRLAELKAEQSNGRVFN